MTQADMNLLVVDDDDAVRNAIRKNLEAYGYRIMECRDGAEACKVVLERKDIALVVSDIRMPNMNGIALTKFIKEKTKVPVILMTGFSELVETIDAYSFGADGFIAKPFNTSDLVAAIRKVIAKDKSTTVVEKDSDFCKLSIDDFISGSQINFDIYIHLAGLKYVKVAHRGENIDINRVKIYKAKGVQFLYMKTSDFAKYLGLNLNLMDAVEDKKGIDQAKKLNLVKHTGELIIETLHFEGVNHESFEQGRAFVESMVNIMSQQPEINNLLTLLLEHSDVLYIHSVAVALYSQMVARLAGWGAFSTLAKVTMGGLLHDIGEKEIAREVLLKPRHRRSLPEVKAYESHSVRGLEILTAIDCVPREVIQIVHQHHENCTGSGYPSQFYKEQIFPPARLIAVVDEFCNLVLSRIEDRRLSPQDAIIRIEEVAAKSFDQNFMKCLKSLFSHTGTFAA